MPDRYIPEAEFNEWWPNGQAWWIQNSESVKNLVRKAFVDAWALRDAQLAEIARTPDSDDDAQEARRQQLMRRHAPPRPQMAPAPRRRVPPSVSHPAGTPLFDSMEKPWQPDYVPEGWPQYVPLAPLDRRYPAGPPPVTRIQDYDTLQRVHAGLTGGQYGPVEPEEADYGPPGPVPTPVSAEEEHRAAQVHVETQAMPAVYPEPGFETAEFDRVTD